MKLQRALCTELIEVACNFQEFRYSTSIISLRESFSCDIDTLEKLFYLIFEKECKEGYGDYCEILEDVLKILNYQSRYPQRSVANDGRTLLHLAAEHGNHHLAHLLIKYNAAINAQTDLGQSALHISVCYRKKKLFKLLLAKNANPSIADNHEQTPMHDAATNPDVEFINDLFEKGASVNAKDYEGWTPLHHAVNNSGVEATSIVDKLISLGADVNAEDRTGDSPLHVLALSNRDYGIASMLIKAGARVNCKDRDWNTPLHNAVNFKNTNVMEELLFARADVNAVNRRNETPLSKVYGDRRMAQLLLDYGAEE